MSCSDPESPLVAQFGNNEDRAADYIAGHGRDAKRAYRGCHSNTRIRRSMLTISLSRIRSHSLLSRVKQPGSCARSESPCRLDRHLDLRPLHEPSHHWRQRKLSMRLAQAEGTIHSLLVVYAMQVSRAYSQQLSEWNVMVGGAQIKVLTSLRYLERNCTLRPLAPYIWRRRLLTPMPTEIRCCLCERGRPTDQTDGGIPVSYPWRPYDRILLHAPARLLSQGWAGHSRHSHSHMWLERQSH